MSGLEVTIIYGAAQLVIALSVAIGIYLHALKQGEKLKFTKFAQRVWKLRGVFTPLLIHIYDTSTDIGVLYEWYFLAQREKNGNGIESLDMEQFFWIAIGFMIAYRFLLGCFGIFVVFGLGWFSCCDCCGIIGKIFMVLSRIIVGFVGSALELGIFLAIYLEQTTTLEDVKKKQKSKRQRRKRQKQKQKDDQSDVGVGEGGDDGPDDFDRHDEETDFCAGTTQKMFQFSECVLESLPEAIMQSVFIMRSYNDEYLNTRDRNSSNNQLFIALLYLSIFASIISIANKYMWVDSTIVQFYCESLFISKKTIIRRIAKQFVPESFKLGKLETIIELSKLGSSYENLGKIQNNQYALHEMVKEMIPQLFVNYYQDYQANEKHGSKLNDSDVAVEMIDKPETKMTEDDHDISDTNWKLIDSKMIVENLIDQYTTDDDYQEAIQSHTSWDLEQKRLGVLRDEYKNILKLFLLYKSGNDNYNDNEMKEAIQKLLWRIHRDEWILHWSMKSFFDHKKYFFSLGFLIRAVWRICAVTNRFLIISLIWTVLGGAFEIILLSSMIILWYLMVGCYTGSQYHKYQKLNVTKINAMYKEQDLDPDTNDTDSYSDKHNNVNGVESTKDSNCCTWCHGYMQERLDPDPDNWSSCVPIPCASILLLFGWLVGSVIVGIILQLGIIGLGGEFFLVRIIENITLLSVITLFAFNDKIVCNLCADEDLRQATYNPRILGWIVVAWVSIVMHILTSIYMSKLINEAKALTIKEFATLAKDTESIEKQLEQEKEEKLKQENPEFRNFEFESYQSLVSKEMQQFTNMI